MPVKGNEKGGDTVHEITHVTDWQVFFYFLLGPMSLVNGGLYVVLVLLLTLTVHGYHIYWTQN